jgi:hypothetical protein
VQKPAGSWRPIHSHEKGDDDALVIAALSSRWGSDRLTGGHDMNHASLLNPFHLNQEPARPVRIVNRAIARSTPVCSSCQSDDIIAHATVQWSNESQEWELASTFGRPTHCNYCDGACEITWLPLK